VRRRTFIAGLGGAVALPRAVRAQQPAMPLIGYLSGGSEQSKFNTLTSLPAFRRGLGDQGYTEGRNVEILYRFAEAQNDRLPALAADLARRRVAVIAAIGANNTALAARSATATIPIVFLVGSDPVEDRLVASLNRPSANTTGITSLTKELTAKRLALLHDIVPKAGSLGFIGNPTNFGWETKRKEAENAARILAVHLVIANASTPSDIDVGFAALAAQGISALLVDSDQLFTNERDQVIALAARYRVPAIYPWREMVDAGGLLSYGTSLSDAFRLTGTYVGRILKGDKPTDLPVQQATRIEMVVNLKTAKALGLTVPPDFLSIADEVID